MYHFLDWFFVIFHTSLIVFNLFGWIFKITRKANLITLSLTGGSWFILGIWKGIGYCPFTDWHWNVLNHLGKKNLPNSYVKYLLDRTIGIDIDANIVDPLVGILFFISLGCSIYTNIKYS